MNGHWKGLIILLSCAYVAKITPNSDFNPHSPVQQTWEVLNEEGDVVWSASATQPPWVWWPDMTPDICKLVAGLPSWDLSGHTSLINPPNEKQCVPNGIGMTYGCSGQFYRANLRSAEFYVCPAQGQTKKLRLECGGASDFYCAKWGCETTGDAGWNPSSSWDLITVKRGGGYDKPNERKRDSYKYLKSGCASWRHPNGVCKDKYCNPILIRFTNQGKQARQSWLRGNSWGLRLYAPGKDPGLIFKIKLTIKSTPTVPIGPNQVLPERGPPTRPKPPLPITAPSAPVETVTAVSTTYPSTGQRLFNLVKGAFYALNSTDPGATISCWLCLSSGPPYYKDIAYNRILIKLATMLPVRGDQEKN